MGTDLKDYIKVYDNILSKPVCEGILSCVDRSNSEYIDRGQRPSFSDLNISVRYLEKDPLWVSLYETIMESFSSAAKRYVEDLDVGPDFPDRYAFEQFRIKTYANNDYDQFKDHVDVGNHDSAKRFLVLFLYLNDVEEGGQTSFPKLDYQVTPKCGRMLVFPPTWQYRHAGLPPVSGPKTIVGSYLHYL